MVDSVVHVELIGRDPAALREFSGRLFGWEFETPSPVAAEVSDPSDYGFLSPAGDARSVAGGIGRDGRGTRRPDGGWRTG